MFVLTCPLQFYQYGLIRVTSSKSSVQIDSTGFIQDKNIKQKIDQQIRALSVMMALLRSVMVRKELQDTSGQK